MTENNRPYRFFEVTGIELEYPTVTADLEVRNLVEPLFRAIAGRPSSDVQYRHAIFSNELAAHVFEVKTSEPERSLARAENRLIQGIRYVSKLLRDRFEARLLPSGMHPFMDPASGGIWPRSGRPIYATYARIFPVKSHGWMNVHSCHVNLPFGSEEETVLLHNAICCLLPYLPALAANSPVYDGALGPYVCNRLAFYRRNQERLPMIAGRVVPEYMTSYRQYRREILKPIYQALANVDGGARLRHEWVNSRGAILRFMRSAIEIRILDVQECVRADIAIAVFVRASLRFLTEALRDRRLELPPHGLLVDDFNAVVEEGSKAAVSATHLRRPLGVGGRTVRPIPVLQSLLDLAGDFTPTAERNYLQLVADRLERGNLSERIRRRLARTARASDARRRDAIHGLYGELMDCLETNTSW